jgi:ribonuclease P protein component
MAGANKPEREGADSANRSMTRVSRRESMTRRSEFALVREKGRSQAGRYLVMATMEDAALEGCKFGFVTSKRVGNAVVRNRVRRQLRSVVREYGEELQAGRYVVMIARFRAGEADYEELVKDWRKLVRQLEIGKEAE